MGLQWVAVRRFYLYCILLHGVGIVVAMLIAFDVPGGGRGVAFAGLPRRELAQVLAAAGMGMAGLVLGQVLVMPKTFVVRALALVGGCNDTADELRKRLGALTHWDQSIAEFESDDAFANGDAFGSMHWWEGVNGGGAWDNVNYGPGDINGVHYGNILRSMRAGNENYSPPNYGEYDPMEFTP